MTLAVALEEYPGDSASRRLFAPDAGSEPELHAFSSAALDALATLEVPCSVVFTRDMAAAWRVRDVPGAHTSPGYSLLAQTSVYGGELEILVNASRLDGGDGRRALEPARIRQVARHEAAHAFLYRHGLAIDLRHAAEGPSDEKSATAGYVSAIVTYVLQEYTADLWGAGLSDEPFLARRLQRLAADWERVRPLVSEASRAAPSRLSVRPMMQSVIGFLEHVAQAAAEMRLGGQVPELPDGVGELVAAWEREARAIGDVPNVDTDVRVGVIAEWSRGLATWLDGLIGFRALPGTAAGFEWQELTPPGRAGGGLSG